MTTNIATYCCAVSYFKHISFENYGLSFQADSVGIVIPLYSYIGIDGYIKRDGLSKMQAARLVSFLNDFIEGKI